MTCQKTSILYTPTNCELGAKSKIYCRKTRHRWFRSNQVHCSQLFHGVAKSLVSTSRSLSRPSMRFAQTFLTCFVMAWFVYKCLNSHCEPSLHVPFKKLRHKRFDWPLTLWHARGAVAGELATSTKLRATL